MTPDQAKEHLLEVAASGIATRMRKYVEIQLDIGTWDALQDWKRQGAVLSDTAPMLALLRKECSVDDNGDPVGQQPAEGWEAGYAAGVRHVYRILKGNAASQAVAQSVRASGKSAEAEDTEGRGFESRSSAESASRCVEDAPIKYKATLIFDHETRIVSGEFWLDERPSE